MRWRGRLTPLSCSLTACVLLAGGAILCSPAPEVASTSELQFGEPRIEPPAAIIGQRQDASFRVGYRNLTGRPLKFLEMSASCTCLQCEPVERSVAPGAVGELKGRIRLPTSGRDSSAGAKLNIRMEFPDGSTCRSELSLYVPVRPAVDCDLSCVRLQGDAKGRRAEVKFTQFALSDQALSAPVVEAKGNFEAAIEEGIGPAETDGAFLKRSFTVRFVAHQSMAGGGNGGAVLLFGAGKAAPLEMPVDWADAAEFSIQPACLVLDESASPAAKAVASVSARDGAKCRFLDASSDHGELFRIELPPADDGRTIQIAAVGKAERATLGKVQLRVEHGGRIHPATLTVLYIPRGTSRK